MSDGEGGKWPAVERGGGPALVFLHGYPLNHSMWQSQLEALSTDHRVVLLDLPGFGLAAERSVPDTLEGFAERVQDLLAHHVPGRAVIVGHSFGGYVALQLFREHPERFAGLVLADTRSEADSVEAREKRLALVQRLEKPGETLDVEESTRGLLAPATWEAGGPLVDRVRAMVRDARSPALRGSLSAMAHRPDLTPVLASINVPTLVVWGEEDRLIPPSQSRSMVARIRGGEGVGIPGAGHLPAVEAPGPFESALRSWLSRTAPP
jgi:3-oxoadipate enol-lactonase